MLKHIPRFVAGAALLASTSGCYNLAINGQDLTKPVSMSQTLGRPATVVRHFKQDMVLSWYILGILPIASFPGVSSPMTPAPKLVSTFLTEELAKGGDGIINLKITQQFDIPSLVASVVVGIVPFVGPLFNPITVSLEGDVVEFSKRGAITPETVITQHDGQVDWDGVNVTALVADALYEAEAARLKATK